MPFSGGVQPSLFPSDLAPYTSVMSSSEQPKVGNADSLESPGLHRYARWYILGTFLAGLTTGLLTGLSQSPVVAVLVPLLLGLLGGTGGFYLAAIGLSNKQSRERVRLFGLSLTALMLGVLPSTLYGTLVRQGLSPMSLWLWHEHALPANAIDIPKSGDAGMYLELAILRNKLAALGATPDEQRGVLELARLRTDTSSSTGELQRLCNSIAAKAKQARELFTEDVMTSAENANGVDAHDVFAFVRLLGSHYAFCADRVKHEDGVALSLRTRVAQDGERLGRMIHDLATAEWLLNNEQLRNALWDLELTFWNAELDLGVSWMADGQVSKALNEYLTALGESSSPTDNKVSPIVRPSIAR